MNERTRALELLGRIERESAYASLLLIGETPFVRTLVLGVLRWRSRIDAILRSLASRKIDASLLDVLRLGSYQLLFMDVAPYAAVAETVDLAPHFARGFANALLRRIAARDFVEAEDLATRTAHPPWLIERWTRFFGADRATAIAEANQELSQPDVLVLDGQPPRDSTPSTLVERVWKTSGTTAELPRTHYWPMDEGSAVVASIASHAGSEVLDVAAAPGGKSIFMRSAGARVWSNDLSIGRLLPLRNQGQRVIVSDGRSMPFRRPFEAVLLDAPCSASGTIRRSPEIKWRLREHDLSAFAEVQVELLREALLTASAVCIYSTCSLEPEENDAVVAATGAERLDIGDFVPPGAKSWVENGILRLTPESGADGFTAFALRGRA